MLNQGAFDSLGLYLDGLDACQLRLVCKRWKHLVDHSLDLSWKRRVHLIQLEDISLLRGTIGKSLVALNPTEAKDWMENILWFNYEKNPYFVYAGEEPSPYIFPQSFFIETFPLAKEEGNRGILQNTETREVIYLNNFYDCFASFCQENSTCTDADHLADKVAEINARYPGLVSNWKVVHFPFLPVGRLDICGQDFHRGSTVIIYISPGKLKDAFNISAYLKRMAKAIPPIVGYTGKGKRQRTILHEHLWKNSKRVKTITHSLVTEKRPCKYKTIPYFYREGRPVKQN